MTQQQYIIDTSVLVQAKRENYPFDTFPGFWKFISHGYDTEMLHSIDHVRREILNFDDDTDDLSVWAKNTIPKSFFKPTNTSLVRGEYDIISQIIEANQDYNEEEIQKFLTGADAWLIAYARANSFIVVSEEDPARTATSLVRIPDICKLKKVKVPHCDTASMLRQLGARFELTSTSLPASPKKAKQGNLIS